MVVHGRQTDATGERPARVGFVVSKAVGNAVVRNRTKRRLRALVAARLEEVPGGVDLVVRARPAAAGAPGDRLAADLGDLLERVLGHRRIAGGRDGGRGR